MELAIFNTDKSEMTARDEIKVLWNSVLLADRIYYDGVYTDWVFFKDVESMKVSEKEKLDFVLMLAPSIYGKKIKDIDKFRNDVHEFYADLLKARRIRGKNKSQMLSLIEGEKVLKDFFRDANNHLKWGDTILDIEWLKPHISESKDTFIVCYAGFTSALLDDTEAYLKDVSKMFTDSLQFPVSNDCIEKFQYDEITNTPTFYSVNIVDIPDFNYLREIQYMQFRQNFIPQINDLSGFLYSFKETMKEHDFNEHNINLFSKLIMDGLAEFRTSLKICLNENLEKYTDVSLSGKMNKLRLGFTSVENFFDIYNKAGLFGDDFSLYLREFVAREMDLKRMMPFLYVRFGEE